MKSFRDYPAAKYAGREFVEVEPGIYQRPDPYGEGEIFVTSLSFELEPDSYGEENGSPQNIPQIPLEDLLDEFYVFISDFYEELNAASDGVCYQEFASADLADIKALRGIIGKRVYAALEQGEDEEPENNSGEFYRLVIE